MPISYFQKLTSPDFWKKPRHLWLGLIVLVGIAVIVFFMASEEPKIVPSDEVVPSEVVPLASGKRTYEIITGSSQKFKIIEVDVDSLDIKQGETQVVTVQVKDSEGKPITYENKVEAIVYTDNTATPFPFSLKKVEDADLATITTWEGSWVCEDTYDLRYAMTIKAKSAKGEHSIDLSFR